MRVEFSDIDNQYSINENWEQNRRAFIRNILFGSVAFSFLSFPGCISESSEFDGKGIFTSIEMNTLYRLQLAIFPSDNNGPSAEDIRALDYFMWYLTAANTPQNDIVFFTSGLQKITKKISNDFLQNTSVDQLTTADWQNIIPQLCITYELKDWLSKTTTLLFEALLLDPVYGGNTNEIGWEWLNHQPGIPRPTASTKYPDYLDIIYG
jgi:gluconate 2-dehydrogenase gamma chain